MKEGNQNKRLKPMSRDEYDKFKKTLPRGICLFCKYKDFQIIIHEWKYWILIQPLSPYFKYHMMLCTKRHIKYLNELNIKERTEFWRIDKKINAAYVAVGIKKLRFQLHMRFPYLKPNKKLDILDINEHLHIHYYRFKDDDFRILVSKMAYKQDLKRLFGKFF